MTNMNLIDFVDVPSATETVNERTLTLSGFAGGLADGDYGDITVSGGGTVMTIDNGAVTAAKTNMFTGLANITVGTVAPGSPSVGDLWIDTN